MLIRFDPQPRGTPVLQEYISPSGERFHYHAVEECGWPDGFYRCPTGDPVDVVQVDGVWFWEVEDTLTPPADSGTMS